MMLVTVKSCIVVVWKISTTNSLHLLAMLMSSLNVQEHDVSNPVSANQLARHWVQLLTFAQANSFQLDVWELCVNLNYPCWSVANSRKLKAKAGPAGLDQKITIWPAITWAGESSCSRRTSPFARRSRPLVRCFAHLITRGLMLQRASAWPMANP